MTIQGSCLCGTLRYEVEGPLTSMLHCHCSRCRKEHGAPFATFATADINALNWIEGEDAVTSHVAAPGGPRHFCATCGSAAPSKSTAHGLAFIPVGNLDGDVGLRPQGHLFAASKASWYTITDTLPQHAQYPPEFGDVKGLPDPPPVESLDGKTLGSCLCGEVRFEASGPPLMMFQCHCSRCRKSRSAAHGANAFWKLENFRWLHGAERVREYRLPEARFFAVAFCGQCGSKVPKVSVERGMVVVPVSSLDTDPGMRPMAHIFVGSKAPWFEISDALPQYPEGPPGLGGPPPR